MCKGVAGTLGRHMGTPVYADMTVVSVLALGMEVFLLFLH